MEKLKLSAITYFIQFVNWCKDHPRLSGAIAFCIFQTVYALILVYFFGVNNVHADIPRHAQTTFQDPATLAMISIVDLHHGIMFWLISTTVVVVGLFSVELYYFLVKEQEEAILVTWQRLLFTDDFELEAVWTIAPMIATYWIAIPSVSLLYGMDEDNNYAKIDMTLKIIGRQWYWSYEMDEFVPSIDNQVYHRVGQDGHTLLNLSQYLLERFEEIPQHHIAPLGTSLRFGEGVDQQEFDYLEALHDVADFLEGVHTPEEMQAACEKFKWDFDGVLANWNWDKNQLGAFKLRLLETIIFLILPVKRNIQLFVTSDDVIHSFALPSAGIKIDALPGRLNSLIIGFFREALMFGQCSEICGAGHGFMPISLLVLPEAYLAYNLGEVGEITYAIVERYKICYRYHRLAEHLCDPEDHRCYFKLVPIVDENPALFLKKTNKEMKVFWVTNIYFNIINSTIYSSSWRFEVNDKFWLNTDCSLTLLEAQSENSTLFIFFSAAVVSVALLSFYNLSNAFRPAEAIFSFFVYLLVMASSFFAIESDYIGSIIFIVYLGAILIFFVFVLFTLEPRWFASSFAPLIGDQQWLIVLQFATAIFYVTVMLAYLWQPLAGSFSLPISNVYFDKAVIELEPTAVQSYGASLYMDYLLPTVVLGVLLLLALLLAMELLVSRPEKRVRKSFYNAHFITFSAIQNKKKSKKLWWQPFLVMVFIFF